MWAVASQGRDLSRILAVSRAILLAICADTGAGFVGALFRLASHSLNLRITQRENSSTTRPQHVRLRFIGQAATALEQVPHPRRARCSPTCLAPGFWHLDPGTQPVPERMRAFGLAARAVARQLGSRAPRRALCRRRRPMTLTVISRRPAFRA